MTDHEPTPVPESAKARFREALERKRESEHRTVGAPPNTGSVHGSETHGGRRTFRRKTG
jgi:hypothetical protein